MFALCQLAAAPPKDTRLAVDTQRSTITVHVGKQGIFAFAADTHDVSAPIASGQYDPATKSIELKIDAAKMRVLDPPNRWAKVQANMVGPLVLDAARYPQILFRSTRVQSTEGNTLTVSGDLTLHGQTHPIVVHVVEENGTHFKGSTTLRQTAFGISPIRIAGGTVKVKDELNIEFELVVR